MDGHAHFMAHGAVPPDTFHRVKQEDASHFSAFNAYPSFQSSHFSDLELAESLGWTGPSPYPQAYEADYRIVNAHPSSATPDAHQGRAQQQPQQRSQQSQHSIGTTSAQSAIQNLPPATTASYGTMPIPHAPSPAWSGMESPSFLADPSPLSRGLARTSTGKDKADISDKKAMRRYSHNAGKSRYQHPVGR